MAGTGLATPQSVLGLMELEWSSESSEGGIAGWRRFKLRQDNT